jgi:hypothetical protein
MVLTITPIGLHWLANTLASRDLCAHAGLTVERDGVRLLDATDEELAVSTTAVHLLRTLRTEHVPERPIAEQLAPHCGHWMFVDAATGAVVNGGCPHGVNWWVRRTAGIVRLEFPDGVVAELPHDEWCRAVVAFADAVDHLYATSDPKEFADGDDAEWFPAFRDEWRARRAAAPCAA